MLYAVGLGAGIRSHLATKHSQTPFPSTICTRNAVESAVHVFVLSVPDIAHRLGAIPVAAALNWVLKDGLGQVRLFSWLAVG